MRPEESCQSCIYAVKSEGWECHRNAPRPTLDRESAWWPYVEATNWCGEYVKTTEPEPK